MNRLGNFETVFVLFFLSLDLGQNLLGFSFDSVFMLLTVALVATLPYVIERERGVSFGSWVAGRSLVVGFAVLLGIGYSNLVGTLVPAEFGFLPLAFAALAGVISCAMMYRNVLFFRYAE